MILGRGSERRRGPRWVSWSYRVRADRIECVEWCEHERPYTSRWRVLYEQSIDAFREDGVRLESLPPEAAVAWALVSEEFEERAHGT